MSVSDGQKQYVAYPTVLLARAYAYRDYGSHGFMIMENDVAVGMALYYDSDRAEKYEFSQFFIDERYQGKGIGYEACKMILDLMVKDGRFDEVELCIIEGNYTALRMYEKTWIQTHK